MDDTGGGAVSTMVDHESLVWLYLREIRLDGRAAFVAGTLATLRAAATTGEVATTSRGDRSVSMRLSPIAIEARIGAALLALEHYDNQTEPGARSVLLDRSSEYTAL
jgi:hypothetical protein